MFPQLLANALIAASVYTLAGNGFALVFRAFGSFDFSYGLSYPLGAYAAFVVTSRLNLPGAVCVVFSACAAIALGVCLNIGIYAPLRRRGASTMVLFLASLGAYIVGQNLLSLLFGDAALSIQPDTVTVGRQIFGARISDVQLIIIGIAVATTVITAAFLAHTGAGRQIRAVANDPALAAIRGIRVDRVLTQTVALGAGVGGIAGYLFALDRNIVPTMGMSILLYGIVAMIAGGRDSIIGIALGAGLLGLVQNLSLLWISAMWQDALVFGVLILFLLLRPRGMLGSELRVSTPRER
jgi:branched-chain amino acid transport system permease protein